MSPGSMWALVIGVAIAPVAHAQMRNHPTEPVKVKVPVAGLEEQAKADLLATKLKALAETADVVVVDKVGFTFAVKKDLVLTWTAVREAIEGTEAEKPLVLGDPMLAGKVRIRFDSELTGPERKAQLAGVGAKIKALGGVTALRATKEGGVEIVVAAPGMPLSKLRGGLVKWFKLPADLDPIYEVTWYGPKDPPPVTVQPGSGTDD